MSLNRNLLAIAIAMTMRLMDKKEKKVEHIFEKHVDCREPHCPICDGGLAVCVECGQCEGDLEESCPGPKESRSESR